MRGRLIKIGAGLVVLAALAGGGVAWATAGDDEWVTGPEADRARAVALAHVGEGQIVGVERESEGSAWEVEVQRPDGSTVEVALDSGFGLVTVGAEEDEDDAGEDEDGE